MPTGEDAGTETELPTDHHKRQSTLSSLVYSAVFKLMSDTTGDTTEKALRTTDAPDLQ